MAVSAFHPPPHMTDTDPDSDPEPQRSFADAPASSGDERQETITLGQHLNRTAVVSIRQRPAAADAPDEFAANLSIPGHTAIDVFRVDTAHSGCHADRLYLPENHPRRREDYSVQFTSPDEVLRWLLNGDRWRTFIEQYNENHGLTSRQTDED